MTRAFSVVIPVKDEADLINQNLLSWISLKPSEIIVCTDQPPASGVLKALNGFGRVVHDHGVELFVIPVPKTHGWRFHQAYVRRCGFRAAHHDVILTGDIDLYVNMNCLKAVELVGKDGVGLVSVSKKKTGDSLIDWLRHYLLEATRYYAKFVNIFSKTYLGQTYFTGLYVLYRPYWLDSEGDGIRGLENPKYAEFNPASETPFTGEDTYLRNRMIKKHKVVYLADVGGIDRRPSLENQRDVQIRIGRRFAVDNRRLYRVIRHSIIRLRPFIVYGWMLQKVGK